MRGIPGTKMGKLLPPAATADELALLKRNCAIACVWYGLSEAATKRAQQSAHGSHKAARCYAAIVRSL